MLLQPPRAAARTKKRVENFNAEGFFIDDLNIDVTNQAKQMPQFDHSVLAHTTVSIP
jgi:hypothetical protein